MSMAGRRSTTRALRQPPCGGFRRLLSDSVRRSRSSGGLTQKCCKAIALLLEGLAVGTGNRGTAADLDPAGVLGHTVDTELVMQVRPAGQSCRPNVADHLSLLDSDAT